MAKRKHKPIAPPSRESSDSKRKKQRKKGKKQKESEEAFQIIDSELHTIVECSEDYYKEKHTDLEEIVTSKVDDSSLRASQTFEWLISPLSIEDFFEKYFEKKALLVRRHSDTFFGGFPNFEDLKKMATKHSVTWTRDLLASDPVPSGKVSPSQLASMKGKRWLQLSHPEQFNKTAWRFLEQLEEFWGVTILSSIEWTPPGNHEHSQHVTRSLETGGPLLAPPHAIILGLAGERPWELLWDADFQVSASSDADPPATFRWKETLRGGDLLYVPPGWTARPVGPLSAAASHATLTFVPNSWAEFLQVLLSRALEEALDHHPSLRSALPLGWLSYTGLMHPTPPTLSLFSAPKETEVEEGTGKEEKEEEEEEDEEEEGVEGEKEKGDERYREFSTTLTEKIHQMISTLPVAGAADELGVAALQGRLPPVPGPKGPVPTINRNSYLRLVAPSAVRLTFEDNSVQLYCRTDNERTSHGVPVDDPPADCLELPLSGAAVIESLVASFPQWVRVDALPGQIDETLTLLRQLQEHHLLVLDV